jgi:hypothetical protein
MDATSSSPATSTSSIQVLWCGEPSCDAELLEAEKETFVDLAQFRPESLSTRATFSNSFELFQHLAIRFPSASSPSIIAQPGNVGLSFNLPRRAGPRRRRAVAGKVRKPM